MSDPARATALREALLAWYPKVARDLPWRRAPTPYAVLLSELMLQQTRVETVIPYFERFLARWPTLDALAAASDDEVLHAWAGLGYYRRARALLAAARAASAAGGLRGDVAWLRALPGVGPYTAGAIASIAFGVPAAAVDGNVERALCRVASYRDNPRSTAGKRWLEATAAAISAPGVAGDVTQALIELGATVCAPRSPACGRCPWAAMCAGRRDGVAASLPALPAKAAPKEVRGVCVVVRGRGGLLLGRRPEGLLGGLWEPVMDEVEAPVAEAAVAAVRRRAGRDVTLRRPLGEVVHVFTHRRLRLSVWEADDAGPWGAPDGSYDALMVGDGNPAAIALSVLARKVLDLHQAAPRLPLAAQEPGGWGGGAPR